MIYFIRAVITAFFAYLAFSFIAADWWWMLSPTKDAEGGRLAYITLVLVLPITPFWKLRL